MIEDVIQYDPEERRRTMEALAALSYTPPDPATRRQTREYARKLARESNACSPAEYRMAPEALEALLDEVDALFDRVEDERAACETHVAVPAGLLTTDL